MIPALYPQPLQSVLIHVKIIEHYVVFFANEPAALSCSPAQITRGTLAGIRALRLSSWEAAEIGPTCATKILRL